MGATGEVSAFHQLMQVRVMLILLIRCCDQTTKLNFDREKVDCETIKMPYPMTQSLDMSNIEPHRLTVEVISYLPNCGVLTKAVRILYDADLWVLWASMSQQNITCPTLPLFEYIVPILICIYCVFKYLHLLLIMAS